MIGSKERQRRDRKERGSCILLELLQAGELGGNELGSVSIYLLSSGDVSSKPAPQRELRMLSRSKMLPSSAWGFSPSCLQWREATGAATSGAIYGEALLFGEP